MPQNNWQEGVNLLAPMPNRPQGLYENDRAAIVHMADIPEPIKELNEESDNDDSENYTQTRCHDLGFESPSTPVRNIQTEWDDEPIDREINVASVEPIEDDVYTKVGPVHEEMSLAIALNRASDADSVQEDPQEQKDDDYDDDNYSEDVDYLSTHAFTQPFDCSVSNALHGPQSVQELDDIAEERVDETKYDIASYAKFSMATDFEED